MLSIHSQIGDVGDHNQGVAGLLSPPPHDSFVCVCVCVRACFRGFGSDR